MAKNFLVYGVSKGLGKALVEGIPSKQDTLYGVSRSCPPFVSDRFHWIQTDLSEASSAEVVKRSLQDVPIDCLIYNVGIWEKHAFSDEYHFETTTDTEILTMIQTNISACILHLKAMLPNLRRGTNSKIILIGSTWGLDNHNGHEVAFSASKYALRGIAQSLRETLRQDQIGISVLNLGYLATEYPLSVPVDEVISHTEGSLIPLQDVLNAVKFILSTSHASCVKEITMPAMLDKNV
ncbi:SDR family NAD(P)-dependent oxidoreductase [Providencia manganoxydans]|uniref:SDR family NAD(P)-dependent oxidoreductase n=1 Tax=Providencia manganoxydans TaxID=2923283 RepID=A0ABX7AJF6_9GAMM|nr:MULTISPECIES: SDR family NAD(P)-dependent oxidoreductase [Providencia]MDX4945078.1 SDR family NAD(P)-dependent oxidoreductase [Providencia manganoxydans]QQO64055.1 SDR family NAD(P)-dependent oxidoreductase [Providencia manganoxydans]HEF8773824.1 SDR family NAD(P)-dependent oxidoreductase [Providencia stuartii]